MTLKLDIDCPDALRVAHDYEQVGERCTDLKRPFREAADLLEHVHERGFARLRGRYVLTGATRSSLTGSGAGSIRDASRTGLMFGTSVWYSHFLTKSPRDPNLSQVAKKPPGKGRYAVLFFPRDTQREITQLLLDYVVDPFGDER
jgi:hypothetical protein